MATPWETRAAADAPKKPWEARAAVDSDPANETFGQTALRWAHSPIEAFNDKLNSMGDEPTKKIGDTTTPMGQLANRFQGMLGLGTKAANVVPGMIGETMIGAGNTFDPNKIPNGSFAKAMTGNGRNPSLILDSEGVPKATLPGPVPISTNDLLGGMAVGGVEGAGKGLIDSAKPPMQDMARSIAARIAGLDPEAKAALMKNYPGISDMITKMKSNMGLSSLNDDFGNTSKKAIQDNWNQNVLPAVDRAKQAASGIPYSVPNELPAYLANSSHPDAPAALASLYTTDPYGQQALKSVIPGDHAFDIKQLLDSDAGYYNKQSLGGTDTRVKTAAAKSLADDIRNQVYSQDGGQMAEAENALAGHALANNDFADKSLGNPLSFARGSNAKILAGKLEAAGLPDYGDQLNKYRAAIGLTQMSDAPLEMSTKGVMNNVVGNPALSMAQWGMDQSAPLVNPVDAAAMGAGTSLWDALKVKPPGGPGADDTDPSPGASLNLPPPKSNAMTSVQLYRKEKGYDQK